MKIFNLRCWGLFFVLTLISWQPIDDNWIIEKHDGYTLLYTSTDKRDILAYEKLIENGMAAVHDFFNAPYKNGFSVYIHPNRHSLDSTWQINWRMPEFTSACWMVASGVATRLDMISPVRWDRQACEHHYADSQKTQQLITHELVHVYHGQVNVSPDFSQVEGIDWFIEGLATYASGQCDSGRTAEIKKAISANLQPKSLDSFWNGKLQYGLSGSMVMFIDKKYGRSKLKELLPVDKKADVLLKLNTTEAELLDGWKVFMLKR